MDNFKEAVMEDEITNIEVVDNPDGSANVTMDISDEIQVMLMKSGLQYLIDEMGATDKVKVLPLMSLLVKHQLGSCQMRIETGCSTLVLLTQLN